MDENEENAIKLLTLYMTTENSPSILKTNKIIFIAYKNISLFTLSFRDIISPKMGEFISNYKFKNLIIYNLMPHVSLKPHDYIHYNLSYKDCVFLNN